MPNEDFKSYKKRLRKENKALKERTRPTAGNIVWNSANIVRKPGGDITDLVKVKNEGTYVKGVGLLHSSLSDKNKYDRIKDKAERRSKGDLKNE